MQWRARCGGQAPQAPPVAPCARCPVLGRALNARSPPQTGHCSRSGHLPYSTHCGTRSHAFRSRKASIKAASSPSETRGCWCGTCAANPSVHAIGDVTNRFMKSHDGMFDSSSICEGTAPSQTFVRQHLVGGPTARDSSDSRLPTPQRTVLGNLSTFMCSQRICRGPTSRGIAPCTP